MGKEDEMGKRKRKKRDIHEKPLCKTCGDSGDCAIVSIFHKFCSFFVAKEATNDDRDRFNVDDPARYS